MPAPDPLTTAVRDARALANRGALHGARSLLEPALDRAVGILGPDHPDVLAATRLLASLHQGLGDLPGARRLLEEALAAGQFTLGEDSPALLPLSYDLAELADELGNRHEARRNFTVVARHGAAVLGADHEYVLAARRYLEGSGSSSGSGALPSPGPAAPTPTQRPPASPPPAPPIPPIPRQLPPAPPRPLPDLSVGAGDAHRRYAHRHHDHRHDEHRHSRLPMLALVLVAAMALVGVSGAAYLALHGPGHAPGGRPQPTPTAEALQPPGDLRLRDDGSSVTLTWADPTKGTVPFVIAAGRADNALNPVGSVESGKNSFTLNGLSAGADYCFLVAAVYSPQRTVPSALACTRRGHSPSPRR